MGLFPGRSPPKNLIQDTGVAKVQPPTREERPRGLGSGVERAGVAVMVPKGGSHLLSGAAHGENPLGERPQVGTDLGDPPHKGTTAPGMSPRGDAQGGAPPRMLQQGAGAAPAGADGRLFGEKSSGKRERRGL